MQNIKNKGDLPYQQLVSRFQVREETENFCPFTL